MALRQIAHTAMQQFGRARGRAAGKVTGLDQSHPSAFERRLHGNAKACGAPAHDQQVQRFGCPGGQGFSQCRKKHNNAAQPSVLTG